LLRRRRGRNKILNMEEKKEYLQVKKNILKKVFYKNLIIKYGLLKEQDLKQIKD
jgi:hypothetical protein